MSEEIVIGVKAYMDLGDGKKKVKRFGLDNDEVSDFDEFEAKVRRNFEEFDLGDLSFSWEDSDGDIIEISTTDQLSEAVRIAVNSKDKLLRINVEYEARF